MVLFSHVNLFERRSDVDSGRLWAALFC